MPGKKAKEESGPGGSGRALLARRPACRHGSHSASLPSVRHARDSGRTQQRARQLRAAILPGHITVGVSPLKAYFFIDYELRDLLLTSCILHELHDMCKLTDLILHIHVKCTMLRG